MEYHSKVFVILNLSWWMLQFGHARTCLPFTESRKQKVYIIYDKMSNLDPSSLLAVLTHLGVAILYAKKDEEGSRG